MCFLSVSADYTQKDEKKDYLGTADVYFNYDESGKIKILKLTFTPER